MFLINNILTDKSIKTLLTACVLNDFLIKVILSTYVCYLLLCNHN